MQLHGQEPPGLITALKSQHLTVTKAVFASRTPGIETIDTGYQAADFFWWNADKALCPGEMQKPGIIVRFEKQPGTIP